MNLIFNEINSLNRNFLPVNHFVCDCSKSQIIKFFLQDCNVEPLFITHKKRLNGDTFGGKTPDMFEIKQIFSNKICCINITIYTDGDKFIVASRRIYSYNSALHECKMFHTIKNKAIKMGLVFNEKESVSEPCKLTFPSIESKPFIINEEEMSRIKMYLTSGIVETTSTGIDEIVYFSENETNFRKINEYGLIDIAINKLISSYSSPYILQYLYSLMIIIQKVQLYGFEVRTLNNALNYIKNASLINKELILKKEYEQINFDL